MKNKILKIAIIVSLIVIIVDQGTKLLVTNFAPEGWKIVENTGMAFGFNDGNFKNIILTIFILLVIISFLRNQKNELDTKTTIAVSLALGGGISNLIDRIFRGGVLDFIKIWKLPNFNIADLCVCLAWGLLIIFLVLYTNKTDVIKDVDIEELKIKGNKNKENKDEPLKTEVTEEVKKKNNKKDKNENSKENKESK